MNKTKMSEIQTFCSDFRDKFVEFLSEIRTNFFGFQTVLSVWNRNRVISNGTNLFGFQTQVCWITVWNPNKFVPFEITLFRFQTDKTVWNPNKFVQISDSFRTEQFLERDKGDLSEIRTCSDFGRSLYAAMGFLKT